MTNIKSKNNFFALLVAFFVTFCALSTKTVQAQNIENTPYIEVTGNANLEIVPDKIYVQIVLKERIDGKNKITISEQEKKMKDYLKKIGIDLNNLNISDLNADYVTIKKKEKDVITEKKYSLLLNNATTLSKVFIALNELMIDDAYISSVTHTKLDSLKQEVKIKAIRDAKLKAAYLVAAIDNKLGKPLIIRENDYQPYYGDMMYAKRGNVGMQTEEFVEDEFELEFKKIKVQSSVYVRFAIE